MGAQKYCLNVKHSERMDRQIKLMFGFKIRIVDIIEIIILRLFPNQGTPTKPF